MLKQRFSLTILILLVSLAGTACQSPQAEARDSLVWNTYANDYYTVKYPLQWNKIASGLEVGFAPQRVKG